VSAVGRIDRLVMRESFGGIAVACVFGGIDW
jgi:hypothetical protein